MQLSTFPVDSDTSHVAVAFGGNNEDLVVGFGGTVLIYREGELEGNATAAGTTAWQLAQILRASDNSAFVNNSLTHFGSALSATEDLLAVGAFGLNDEYGGYVFVYERRLVEGNVSTWQWALEAVLQATDSSAGNLFGELRYIPYLPCYITSDNISHPLPCHDVSPPYPPYLLP